MRIARATPYWRHLRLGFQWLLAPLFLWGAALAQQPLGSHALLGFLSLHLFLYPGATAFNASFDRDTGPVSGLANPPLIPEHLLAVSLALQAAGAILAWQVNPAFLALYALLALVFAGYSHPYTRWKAAPLASAAAVGLGQGALGVAAGWAAASGNAADASAIVALGSLVGCLATLGFYPSTQIFQVREDAARGDRTLAVTLGPAGALRLGATLLLIAGIVAALLMVDQGRPFEAAAICALFAFLTARNALFARRANEAAQDELYLWATSTRWLAAAGFIALLFVLLLGQGQLLSGQPIRF
jgi:4-hydroxybenzoate polyprenyltransferase